MFHPRNPDGGALSRRYGKKAGKAGREMHFDHLETYFFFQTFSGSRAGLSTEVAARRRREGGKVLG